MLRPLTAEQEAFSNTLSTLLSKQFASTNIVDFSVADNNQAVLRKFTPLGLGEFFSEHEVRKELAHWLVILARESGRNLCPFPLYQTALACTITESAIFGEAVCCAGAITNDSIFECSTSVKKLLLIEEENICREFSILSASYLSTLDLLLPHCKLKLSKGKNLKSEGLPCALISLWRLLKATELAGIAEKVIQLTCDYVKQRKQFGVAIGSFQAIQHSLADMFLASQSLDALVDFAAWASSSSSSQFSSSQYSLSAHAALTYAREQVPGIIECAIQLHGGIGFTWESPLHLYLRRARYISAECSNYCQSSKLLETVKEVVCQ